MTSADARAEFDRLFRRYIPNDIAGAINGNANYLAGLGLLTYIEILGGFVSGDLGLRNKTRTNFDAGLREMRPQYANIDGRLSVANTVTGGKQDGLYAIVRSGFVHEFGVKGESIVYRSEKGAHPGRLGIEIQNSPMGAITIEINVDELLRDFGEAVESVWRRLVAEEEPLLSNVIRAVARLDGYQLHFAP